MIFFPKSQKKLEISIAEYTKEGNISEVRRLINSGADINVKDNRFFETAFHLSCRFNRLEIVKLLINCGFGINTKNNFGETGIYLASFDEYSEIVKLLIISGAKLNNISPFGDTVLHFACMDDKLETAKLLLSYGVNVGIRTKDYLSTALHHACSYGFFEIVKLLINYIIDLNITDSEEKTVLQLANKFTNFNVARLITIKKYTNLPSIYHLDDF